ncbi:hypothetical protein RvY_17321 [Ramazzottius varieornatus]|uniref:Uncharacterized protein n=1 Tax=Ramazzottius varieornatus TaxID=947166 RepID=A0A1D1W7N8_RAMVA|nr:hypothetical protein RvY_17321 [Ramazzottius varieornatus]
MTACSTKALSAIGWTDDTMGKAAQSKCWERPPTKIDVFMMNLSIWWGKEGCIIFGNVLYEKCRHSRLAAYHTELAPAKSKQ